MPAHTYYIELSHDEQDYLTSLIKTRTIQAQVVDRARILLWKSEARSDKSIADSLGISINTVRRCVNQYLSNGIDLALFDEERSGRPPEITDDAKAWIVSIACQKPCELGYAAELWTLSALHKHIQTYAEQAGYPRLKTVTKPWLQKYLKKMDIKPFKIKYYLERKDPDFETEPLPAKAGRFNMLLKQPKAVQAARYRYPVTFNLSQSYQNCSSLADLDF